MVGEKGCGWPVRVVEGMRVGGWVSVVGEDGWSSNVA